MPKRKRVVDSHCLYRRPGTATIYARDNFGRYNAFRMNGQQVIVLPGGLTTLGPIYGRVNFANNVRFTGRTRSQDTLEQDFVNTPNTMRRQTLWVPLPQTRDAARRQTNQGMNGAMTALTGNAYSATNYAAWYRGRHPGSNVDPNASWEWCHLLAHSMGGADNATNIVAARRGNNSEQLAIESALQMYRMEQAFEMQVTAALLDGTDGRHLGDVIKYEIRCIHGGANFEIYLDCLNAPNPSEIHYYSVLADVAGWANNKLAQMSQQIHGNRVSAEDRRRVLEYIDERL